MLAKVISVWPGGPSLALGDYIVWFKYLFAILFVGWVVGVLLRCSGRFVLGGTLALASVAWLAFSIPLERAYGFIEGNAALVELAPVMVTASRVSASDGTMVGDPNPWPLWSWLLAATAGFSPDRLLSIYFWVPLGSLLFLSLSLYLWLDHLRAARAATWDLSPALAVFFLLFLSAPRLSFLEDAAPLWKEAFWLRPRIAFSIGLLSLALRQVQAARGVFPHALAGLLLALLIWNDWRLGAAGVAGAIVSLFATRRLSKRSWLGIVALAPCLFVYLWTPAPGAVLAPGERTWQTAAVDLLSVTVDSGLVFLLAVYGFVCLARREGSWSSPLLWLTALTFLFYFASSVSANAAGVLDWGLQKTLLRVLMSACAGVGLAQALQWVEATGERRPAWKLGRLGKISPAVLCLAVFLLASLPWCFPYWWYPLEMDRFYTESLSPLSRQVSQLVRWTREETPTDAVFTAGPSYAPWISALAGRRVLYVDRLVASNESSARRTAQSTLWETRDVRQLKAIADAWGITHLAAGRLDDEVAPVNHEFLASSGILKIVHGQARWVRVYEFRESASIR